MVTDELETAADRLRVAVGAFVREARNRDSLPGAQAAALGHLLREGELSITALAERERVRHQSMARTATLLTAAHLASTRPDPEDGRRVLVTITRAGRTLLIDERRKRSRWIAEAMRQALTDDDRTLLAHVPDLLDKLVNYSISRET